MKVNESFAVEDQPFQGSREYDEKLLDEFINVLFSSENPFHGHRYLAKLFLNNRYPNESILKQIAEHKAKIEELKKQLNTK